MSEGFNTIVRVWRAPLPLDRMTSLPNRKVRVAMIAECVRRFEDRELRFHLMRDCRGIYHVSQSDHRERDNGRMAAILDGKAAMRWFVINWLECPHLAEQFVRAIENPSFEFMPFVPVGKRPKRPKKAKAIPRPLFAVQLELATSLVEVICGLETYRSRSWLAEARRTVSKLHIQLHQTEAERALMKSMAVA
jgi:hypothetical protein